MKVLYNIIMIKIAFVSKRHMSACVCPSSSLPEDIDPIRLVKQAVIVGIVSGRGLGIEMHRKTRSLALCKPLNCF